MSTDECPKCWGDTEARERMSTATLEHALSCPRRAFEISGCTCGALDRALSALRAEHQRVVAERDAKQQGLEDLARTLDAASFPPGLSDIWTAADLRMRELKQARAALAASEEKARGLREAICCAMSALNVIGDSGPDVPSAYGQLAAALATEQGSGGSNG